MPDIHILRPHALGLADARALVERWILDAQAHHGMTCVHAQGLEHDEVSFKQPGVEGLLTVTSDRFELTAELGFLLRSFKQKITATIESRLNELLDTPPPATAAAPQPRLKSDTAGRALAAADRQTRR